MEQNDVHDTLASSSDSSFGVMCEITMRDYASTGVETCKLRHAARVAPSPDLLAPLRQVYVMYVLVTVTVLVLPRRLPPLLKHLDICGEKIQKIQKYDMKMTVQNTFF